MRRIQYIFVFLLFLMGGAVDLHARVTTPPPVRYVSPAGKAPAEGSGAKRGHSWEYAYNSLQMALDEITEDPLYTTKKKCYVFVAGSADNGVASDSVVYVPTRRSTDDADGATINTSFRIYEGIYVIGGFKGDEEIPEEGDPNRAYCDSIEDLGKLRVLSSGKLYGEMIDLHGRNELDSSRSWDFKYKSILSGNHHTNNYSFRYDQKRGVYNTSFPLSSYHVVWFGTNGTINPANLKEYKPNIEPKDTVGEVMKLPVDGTLYYLLDSKNKTAIVTKNPTGNYSGDITIPATVMKITESDSKKDTVEYRVTEIRNGAFAYCTGLTRVKIDSGLTTIGQAAFYHCTGLTSVELPKSVTHIMRFAFDSCCNLDSVKYKNYKDTFRMAFPESIKLIDRWAFAHCTKLRSADIPSSINYVGRYAFYGINTIKKSSIPSYEKEEDGMTGRFKGLPRKAKLSGFTIEGGNANSTNLIGHDHTGFGGGVYMVRNTEIEDGIIHHCSATQRGGGVYLDGGGDVNYCYIHTCQSAGFGMQQGYGGGVCFDYDGQVEH